MGTIFKIIRLLNTADKQFICEYVYSNLFFLVSISGTDKEYYASVKLNDKNIKAKLEDLHTQIKTKLDKSVWKGKELAPQDNGIDRVL